MFRAGFIHIRRFFYAVALVGSFLFYVFNVTYFSWMLFLVVILMPFISAAISLPMLGKGGVAMTGTTGEGGMSVQVRAKAVNPLRFRLELENLFTGDAYRQKFAVAPDKTLDIPFETDQCGVIRIGIKRLRMLDAMGIFWMPLSGQKSIEMIIRPEEQPFTGYLSDSIETTVPDASGEKQYVDIREYRQGDPIRDIHWKLTARRGHPIVREYAFYGANNLCIALPFEADPDSIAMQLGRLAGLVRYLDGEDYSYHIIWLEEGGALDRRESARKPEGVDVEEYIDGLFWDVLSRPAMGIASAHVPADVLAANAHVLEVGSVAVIHHEDGLEKEAYA